MTHCSVVTTGQLNTDHVAGLEGLHAEVTVSRRCTDLTELMAVVRTGRADAVLIIGETAPLTETAVGQLHEDVAAIVVISDLPSERSRLEHLGLTTFDDAVPPGQVAQALRGAESGAEPPRTAGVPPEAEPAPSEFSSAARERAEDAQFAALMEIGGLAEDSATLTAVHPAERNAGARSGSVVTAVWGIPGAPGRTTVAVNLAAELALSGRRVLLIDADSYAASVAVHLGLLEESAGIAQVCRAAEFGRLDSEALLRATVEVEVGGRGCDVLTGLPRAHRWPELRPRALNRVLKLSRARYDHIVVDIGSEISPDQDLGFDSPAVHRNSAAQSVLEAADRVITLGTPDPVGFTRLAKASYLYTDLIPEAPRPEVVINKLRKQVVGRAPRRQLTETWGEMGQGGAIAAFLPWEPEPCDAALRAGQVLAEAAADSTLRRQIAALAGIQVSRRRRAFPGQSAGSGRRLRRDRD